MVENGNGPQPESHKKHDKSPMSLNQGAMSCKIMHDLYSENFRKLADRPRVSVPLPCVVLTS